MIKEVHKKKDGFPGQKAIVLPATVIRKNENDPILHNLMVTDIGYYPKARGHYRERARGADQHIFIFCIDGKGWCEIENRKFQIKNNEFLIIPANFQHVYAADESDPWSIYWMHFKDQVEYNEKRIAVFNELFNNLERGAAKQNLAFISLSLGYFLSSFLYQECFTINETNQVKVNPVEQSISFMKQKTGTLLVLQELAEEARQ